MTEEWRDIEGYEGRYQISTYGRVKTINRYKTDGRYQKERLRISEVDRRGYEFVLLFDGDKYHRFSVHVLVANAFIPNPKGKPQVNHIDGNKLNNNVENLEWATASENQIHALKMGLSHPARGFDKPNTVLSEKDVIDIREYRKNGMTLNEIASMYNISFGYVSRIARGERRAYI